MVLFKVWAQASEGPIVLNQSSSSLLKREEDKDSVVSRQMTRLLELVGCRIVEPSILTKIKQIKVSDATSEQLPESLANEMLTIQSLDKESSDIVIPNLNLDLKH